MFCFSKRWGMAWACCLLGCAPCSPLPPAPVDGGAQVGSLGVANETASVVVVYVSFGADSVVGPAAWPLCGMDAGLSCVFQVPGNTTQLLPTGGRYLNATLSFGAPVGCGQTKAELNLNNPSWYDTVDISLVDGYSTSVSIAYNQTTLGPIMSASGNESALGVFPLGCDLCVARSSQTPCGMTPGTSGCKAGSQYAPAVPCQFQGPTLGGGASVVVSYLGG